MSGTVFTNLDQARERNVCPDCDQPAILDFHTGGPPSYRRAPADDMDAIRAMPEATCPNPRHDTWRAFMGIRLPKEAA